MTTRKKIHRISSLFIKKTHSKTCFLGQFFVGLFVLSSLYLIGVYCSAFFQLALPPAIIGIVALAVILLYFRRVPSPITCSAKPMLSHMSLFFIPAIVPIVNYAELIAAFPVALFLAVIVTTLISLAVTAWLSQKLIPSNLLENEMGSNQQNHSRVHSRVHSSKEETNQSKGQQ